jgi:hypothetical protein
MVLGRKKVMALTIKGHDDYAFRRQSLGKTESQISHASRPLNIPWVYLFPTKADGLASVEPLKMAKHKGPL